MLYRPETYHAAVEVVKTRITLGLSLVVAIGSGVAIAQVKGEWADRLFWGLGAGATTVAILNGYTLGLAEHWEKNQMINDDIESQFARLETVEVAPQIPLQPEELIPLGYWDKLLTDRNKYALVFLFAPQGAGKTTLANYMISQTVDSVTTMFITPHKKPDDAITADYRLGPIGQDSVISGYEDDSMTLKELLLAADDEGNIGATIRQVILCLFNEAARRKVLAENGQTKFDEIDIWIDELPEVYTEYKRRGARNDENVNYLMEWSNFLGAVMQQWRKYGMRVFLILQSKTINTIGAQGYAELRDAYHFIRMGLYAEQYANEVRVDPEIIEAMKAQPRQYMINDDPVRTPSFNEMQGAIAIRKLEKIGKKSQKARSKPKEAPAPQKVSYSDLLPDL